MSSPLLRKSIYQTIIQSYTPTRNCVETSQLISSVTSSRDKAMFERTQKFLYTKKVVKCFHPLATRSFKDINNTSRGVSTQKKQKQSTIRIPKSSPTLVLTNRHVA